MSFNPNPKVRHIYVEEVEFLKEAGERDPVRIAERLGVKPASLARALRREGRGDLASPFDALCKRSDRRPRVRICRPCKLGAHEEHRIYVHDSHKCQCIPCKVN